MGNLNSSGSVERFTLANGENKTFSNQANPLGVPGSNNVHIDVKGDENQDSLGNPIDTGSSQVKLQTSEDNVSYSDVATSTVVGRGYAVLTGVVGAFWRVLNNGPAQVHLVVKPERACQIVGAL